MLPACATALNVNIGVWQNDNDFQNVLRFDVYPTPSQKTIHLLYTRTLNAEGISDASLDPNNLCHHYDALILKSGTDDNEEDDGLFPFDEEYMGNSLTQKHSFQQQQQQHQSQVVIYLHIQMILSIKWKMSLTTKLCITQKNPTGTTPSNKTCHYSRML